MLRLITMVCLILSVSVIKAEAAALTGSAAMRWKLMGDKRLSDGGQEVKYRLILPEGHKTVENIEIFYVLKPWAGAGRLGDLPAPEEIYRADPAGNSESPVLTVYCGRPARLEISAGARIDGRFHLARTFVNTYGRSKRGGSGALRVESLPDWPELAVVGGVSYYRAQAGEEIQFGLGANTGGPVSVEIFEEGRQNPPAPVPLGDGRYGYTPPLDPILSAPAYSVTRDLVFVAETGGRLLSYYLPVGRSRYGRLYLEPGLAVVAVSALAGLLAVLRAGRSFKWR